MKKTILAIIPFILLTSCGGNSSSSSTSSATSKTSSEIPTSEISSSSIEPKIEYKELNVISFQPYYSRMGKIEEKEFWKLPEGFTKYGDLLKGAGDYLRDNISSISYEYISKDEVLNADLFKKLGPNQIILFEGHGSFEKYNEEDVEMHSVMWTGQEYDYSKKDTDEDYKSLNLVPGDVYNEALTDLFIEKYVKDLTGSIVYLGNCHSGRDCTFAQAFLKKGAEAVIANSHAIQAAYNSLIEYTTITNLAKINPLTDKPYTIYEALKDAKNKYGQTDQEKYPIANGSEPMVYGNPYYTIAK